MRFGPKVEFFPGGLAEFHELLVGIRARAERVDHFEVSDVVELPGVSILIVLLS